MTERQVVNKPIEIQQKSTEGGINLIAFKRVTAIIRRQVTQDRFIPPEADKIERKK
jgi:hypothetical protein